MTESLCNWLWSKQLLRFEDEVYSLPYWKMVILVDTIGKV